ncbi:hypothetical protein KC349_g139 [Hortaea werneckii]|nr:hypothetical protein KC349_g139 [Hortaea werneckii]
MFASLLFEYCLPSLRPLGGYPSMPPTASLLARPRQITLRTVKSVPSPCYLGFRRLSSGRLHTQTSHLRRWQERVMTKRLPIIRLQIRSASVWSLDSNTPVALIAAVAASRSHPNGSSPTEPWTFLEASTQGYRSRSRTASGTALARSGVSGSPWDVLIHAPG